MPEVVGSKLVLDAVSGRRKFPYCHRPGATHNYIERSDIGVDLCGCFADGGVIAQIHCNDSDLDFGIDLGYLLYHWRYFVNAASCKNYLFRARRSQGDGCLCSEGTFAWAGDED